VTAIVAEGEDVRLRRATPDDVDFLVGLVTHEEVEPFLAAIRPKSRDELVPLIERSQREPHEAGVFVIEAKEEKDWVCAGVMQFEVQNRRSRIASLGGLAVHPRFRGRRLADRASRLFTRHLIFDLGYHRLQIEIYGFNERAIAHAERVGFVREGVKRKAYERHGDWVDGVMYGLIREDLE
jgi:RimJ/RimL family protein N-acetyltransferase